MEVQVFLNFGPERLWIHTLVHSNFKVIEETGDLLGMLHLVSVISGTTIPTSMYSVPQLHVSLLDRQLHASAFMVWVGLALLN